MNENANRPTYGQMESAVTVILRVLSAFVAIIDIEGAEVLVKMCKSDR